MGNFNLELENLNKIRDLFASYSSLLTDDFENRIKQSIRVLHHQYLWGACREAQMILPKCHTNNLFSLIMNLYIKRRKEHQAKFLLLHCFENALRSTLAVEIANLYNQDKDDWFLKEVSNDKAGLKFIFKLFNQRKSHLKSQPKSTFEIFDCFYLVDLENIIKHHWNELSHLFRDEKTYKNQNLPSYGTKEYLLTKISQIRRARNEIFHNKPTKIRFQKDLEILLLRLGYNLNDATNLGEIQSCITLQYHYDNRSNDE